MALRLFLDSADPQAWQQWLPSGLFHGVTTNPTLLRRAAQPCSLEQLAQLAPMALAHGIEELHLQAWGTTTADILAMAAAFRQRHPDTPLVLMGYANPVEAMGQARFIEQAAEAGVDGVIVVDYPPEECGEFAAGIRAAGMDLIFLLSPTSTADRIASIAAMATGYIYYVSLKGITGAGHLDLADVEANLQRIRAVTKLPIGVGFGIRDAATAKAVAAVSDAIVIGSRIIQVLEETPPEKAEAAVQAFLSVIRKAIDE